MTAETALTDAAAPVTTPKKRFEMAREKLSHHHRGRGGWQLAMRQIQAENAVVVVTDKGRVCAGIVADSGQAGEDAIALTNRVGTLRNAAIVEGRETQITRFGQVVARIIPPERIPEYLPGWAHPAPNVATPAVVPKVTTPQAAGYKTTSALVLDERHADRRNLIREAVERRLAGSAGKKAGGAAALKARKRGRPSGETAFAKKDQTLFAQGDEVTEENLAVLDELLKG